MTQTERMLNDSLRELTEQYDKSLKELEARYSQQTRLLNERLDDLTGRLDLLVSLEARLIEAKLIKKG